MSLEAPNLLLRSEKGSALEHSEVDKNFSDLQDFCTEAANTVNQIFDDGSLVANSLNGAGLKDASVGTVKLKEIFAVTDSGTTNAIKIVVSNNVSVMIANMIFFVKMQGGNTGPVSVTVVTQNGTQLASGELLKAGDRPMEAGDLSASSFIVIGYSSNSFQLMNTLGNAEPEIKITTSHSRSFGPIEISLADSQIALNETYSKNHGLGGTPTVDSSIVCVSAEGGYSTGDEIPLSMVWMDTKSSGSPDVDEQQPGLVGKANTTTVQFFRQSTDLKIPDFTSGGVTKITLTPLKWKLKYTARYANPNTSLAYDQRALVYNFGAVRTAMTDSGFMYVIDSQPSDTSTKNSQKPRILKVNLNNNNVTLAGTLNSTVRGDWTANMSVVSWDKTSSASITTTALVAADPSGGVSRVTATLSNSLSLTAGDKVEVSGAIPSDYNGIHTVMTVASATEFTYDITSDPADASTQGSVRKISSISKTIPFVESYPGQTSKLHYLEDGAFSLNAKNITASNIGNVQVLHFVGTGATTHPTSFYAAKVGARSPDLIGGVTTQITEGATINGLVINKYTWDGSTKYDAGSPKTLNLVSDGSNVYTNRATFVALCPVISSVVGVAHNPIKKRLYVITDDRLLHIFTYSSADFPTFFDNASWGAALTYTKTIGLTGGASNSLTQHNSSGNFRQNTVTIDFDPVTGQEMNIIQCWAGVEYGEGGCVNIMPWVE